MSELTQIYIYLGGHLVDYQWIGGPIDYYVGRYAEFVEDILSDKIDHKFLL